MAEWLPNIATVISALLASGAIFAVLDRRRTARDAVQATQRRADGQPSVDMQAITGAAATLVQELQEELTQARQAATEMSRAEREALRRVAALEASMVSLNASVGALETRVATLLGWIHEPGMTVDLLKRLAPLPPAVNGRTT